MPKVSTKTASKIGLFSAIMIIIGAVVGTGIFFRNYNVFKNNGGNPIGILLSWIISGIMVLFLTFSYAELATCKLKNGNDGFGGWAQKFSKYGFGRYSKLSYSLIFYTIDTFQMLFFTGEAVLNCLSEAFPKCVAGSINFGNFTSLYVFLAGGFFFGLFIVLNLLATKGMIKFSDATSLIKFIPILGVIVIGIVVGCLNTNGGIWHGQMWILNQEGTQLVPQPISTTISVQGLIASIPSVLLSFEGYLVIGNVQNDMKNPEKNVPLAIIFGVMIVLIVFILITIGCMTAGTGNVYWLIRLLFGENTSVGFKITTTIMSIFIFICIMSVLNGMVAGGMRCYQANCEEGLLFKGKQLANKKPNLKLYAGAVWFSIITAITWVLLAIPCTILNSDQIVDGACIVMIIIMYFFYGTTILQGFINRYTHRVETKKTKIFPVAAIISVLSSYFVVVYIGAYQFLYQPIQQGLSQGWSTEFTTGWGMFVSKDLYKPLNCWQALASFWPMAVIMILSPFANDLMIKWWDKKNNVPLIWQKPTEKQYIQLVGY